MGIINNISESEFIQAFEDMDRGNNFSVKGRRALYNYLVELSEEIGENLEMDVIGLCCDYEEYEDTEDFLNYLSEQQKEKIEKEALKEFLEEADGYLKENYTEQDFKDFLNEYMEVWLNERTDLIKLGEDLDDGFIIHVF